MLVSKIKPCMSKYKASVRWKREWLIKSHLIYWKATSYLYNCGKSWAKKNPQELVQCTYILQLNIKFIQAVQTSLYSTVPAVLYQCVAHSSHCEGECELESLLQPPAPVGRLLLEAGGHRGGCPHPVPRGGGGQQQRPTWTRGYLYPNRVRLDF